MKNYLKLLLLLIFAVQGCKKNNIEEIELTPDPGYPYTYTTLPQQEMAGKLQEFNSVNTFESLTLNESGILSGSIPVDLSAGINYQAVKNSISLVIGKYAGFLGITNSGSINIETDITVQLNGGIDITLKDYFQYEQESNPTFVLSQDKLNDRKIYNTVIYFRFSEKNNRMGISGRWYPEAYIPGMEIKSRSDALKIAVQNINENHKEIRPVNLSDVEKDKFNKVIFPYSSKNGIEMRECWEVTFWSNCVKTLVDTQTGEIVYYLDYGHMI